MVTVRRLVNRAAVTMVRNRPVVSSTKKATDGFTPMREREKPKRSRPSVVGISAQYQSSPSVSMLVLRRTPVRAAGAKIPQQEEIR